MKVLLEWSGVCVCVCVLVGVKSREGDNQSWGLGPGRKVGWGGWLEGGGLVPFVLVLVLVSGWWWWCRIGARARARRLPQPPGSCRICRLQVDCVVYEMVEYVCTRVCVCVRSDNYGEYQIVSRP